ncbi:MAG: hypothetical protein HYY93_07355 [Planctomycetes bacterium]|nr:hypothetical protein [Planctomycetota bacterium]
MCESSIYSICPRCSYFSTADTDLYCPTCGVTLTSTCLRCGGPIRDPYALFCRACGTLQRPPGPSAATKEPAARKRDRARP